MLFGRNSKDSTQNLECYPNILMTLDLLYVESVKIIQKSALFCLVSLVIQVNLKFILNNR
jgi:hypothetical protein